MDNEEVFLIDSCALMTAKRHYYGFDFAPKFWNELLRYIKSGKVVVIKRVRDEILNGNDELVDWIKTNCQEYIMDEDDCINEYIEVVNYVNGCGFYNSKAINSWSDDKVADPWLIATAKNKGYTIITTEGKPNRNINQQQGSIKIPNIADDFGVKCENTFYMIKKLGIIFN